MDGRSEPAYLARGDATGHAAEAIELADAGRYDDAQAKLNAVAVDLRAAGLTEEADALVLDVPKLSPIAYSSAPANRKQLRYEQHRQQRGRQH